MGFGKEVTELGIKGVQKLTPEIQKYMKGFLGETKQKLVSNMAQNGHPKYQTIYQNLDTLSKSPDENVKEILGLNVHKDLDGILAEGQQLQTSRTASKLYQGPTTTQPGVIKGSSARKILGSQQLDTPITKRAKSIPPNLPQEVIDEYTRESAARLRAGEKNRTDIPYLVDNDDRVYRLDQKGWEYDGDIKQKKYHLIDVDLKRARNAKLDKIRQQKVNLTTRAGTDQRDFYVDPDPKARHKKGLEEPHHRAPLHPSARLKSGLSKREGTILDNYLESKGIVTGNSKYNRDNLPNEVHKKLHSWLKKKKLLTGDDDLTGLSLLQRKKYIDQFIADMKKSDEKTFKIMQAFTRLKKSKTK